MWPFWRGSVNKNVGLKSFKQSYGSCVPVQKEESDLDCLKITFQKSGLLCLSVPSQLSDGEAGLQQRETGKLLVLPETVGVRSEELILKMWRLTPLFPKYELHLQSHIFFHEHKYLMFLSEKSPGKAIHFFPLYISINVFLKSCLKSLQEVSKT